MLNWALDLMWNADKKGNFCLNKSKYSIFVCKFCLYIIFWAEKNCVYSPNDNKLEQSNSAHKQHWNFCAAKNGGRLPAEAEQHTVQRRFWHYKKAAGQLLVSLNALLVMMLKMNSVTLKDDSLSSSKVLSYQILLNA